MITEEKVLRDKYKHIYCEAKKVAGSISHPFKLCLECLDVIHVANESQCPVCRKDENKKEFTAWGTMRSLVMKDIKKSEVIDDNQS